MSSIKIVTMLKEKAFLEKSWVFTLETNHAGWSGTSYKPWCYFRPNIVRPVLVPDCIDLTTLQ